MELNDLLEIKSLIKRGETLNNLALSWLENLELISPQYYSEQNCSKLAIYFKEYFLNFYTELQDEGIIVNNSNQGIILANKRR